ncbi:MAG: NUMOD3 domain-containing DNA-binding protein [Candidatus Pacearchaeota archaeon]|jgi:hypothetical protein
METKIIPTFYIDDVQVIAYELKNKNCFVFKFIDGNEMRAKEANMKFNKIICSDCGHETVQRSRPKLDKIFLCRKCRIKGENNPMFEKSLKTIWIGKYGEETGNSMWDNHIKENFIGENNPFYNKRHSPEMKKHRSDGMKGKYDGENNPMFGKSVYSVWEEKYGKEVADIKFEAYKVRQQFASSCDNNPMFGKSVYSVWEEKYGKEVADIKFEAYKQNMKNAIRKLKETDKWNDILDKISESLKGREFSTEHRRNLRVTMLKRIAMYFPNGCIHQPNFNVNGCTYFDKLAKKTNTQICHALNGGEYHIKDLGYFVDGYDEINNIVYEYDEPYHFDRNGNLREKDKIREEEIRTYLKCEFKRIKSWENEVLI